MISPALPLIKNPHFSFKSFLNLSLALQNCLIIHMNRSLLVGFVFALGIFDQLGVVLLQFGQLVSILLILILVLILLLAEQFLLQF